MNTLHPLPIHADRLSNLQNATFRLLRCLTAALIRNIVDN